MKFGIRLEFWFKAVLGVKLVKKSESHMSLESRLTPGEIGLRIKEFWTHMLLPFSLSFIFTDGLRTGFLDRPTDRVRCGKPFSRLCHRPRILKRITRLALVIEQLSHDPEISWLLMLFCLLFFLNWKKFFQCSLQEDLLAINEVCSDSITFFFLS